MSKSADPFSFANQVLFTTVLKTAQGQADNFAELLKISVGEYLGGFHSEVQEEMGGASAPSFISGMPSAGAWEPLAMRKEGKQKAGQKKKKARPTSFYYRTGKLAEHLGARNSAGKDFGPAKVTVDGKGLGLAEGVKIDRAGRPQYQTGGFAPKTLAYSAITFSVQVEVFKKIQGKSPRSIFGVFKDEKIRTRYAVTELGKYNQPARPLLRPFLEWYGSEGLKNHVRKNFGVTMS